MTDSTPKLPRAWQLITIPAKPGVYLADGRTLYVYDDAGKYDLVTRAMSTAVTARDETWRAQLPTAVASAMAAGSATLSQAIGAALSAALSATAGVIVGAEFGLIEQADERRERLARSFLAAELEREARELGE